MSMDKYCGSTLGTHQTICGNARQFGGIKAVFLIKEGQTTITDWTSEAQWNTAYGNGDVKLLQEISGEYPEPSESTSESLVAGQSDALDSFAHVLNWRDRAVNDANRQFYDDLNQYTAGGFGWYEIKNNKIKVVEDIDIRFMAKLIVPRDDKEVQHFLANAMWDTIQMPNIYDAPANIFDNLSDN